MSDKKIEISIGHDNSNVIIQFSDKVVWLSFSPKEAIIISDLIKEKADSILLSQQKEPS